MRDRLRSAGADPVRLHANIADPDSFYAQLVSVNEALSPEQSESLLMRLVFLLANQVGDHVVLDACIKEAAKPFKTRMTNHG